ncbi:MAG: hypothetical protein ABI625_23235 [bacterium]
MTRSGSLLLLAPAILLTAFRPEVRSDKVQLTMATLHAAALTTSRAAGDSTDAPFLVMTVSGLQPRLSAILPDSGRSSIRANQAVGVHSLTELALAQGDSVQVLISVLENATSRTPQTPSPTSAAKKSTASASQQLDEATRLVAPMVKDGAHWIGSASLLLTNEGGAIYWRRLDCVASCKVLNGPAAAALPSTKGAPGVVELSGSGGTYHLALQANRTP